MVNLPSNDDWPDGWRYSEKRDDYFALTYDLHKHHVMETGDDGWQVEYEYNGKPNGSLDARTTSDNGFELLKRDLYNNFLAEEDKPHDLSDVYNQTLPTYAAVFVKYVPDEDVHPVTGDRRVSNYLELPANEFIIHEFGDGWGRLDVRSVDSVDELGTLVRTMDLPNDGPIPEVETLAPMELNHFVPESDQDTSRPHE